MEAGAWAVTLAVAQLPPTVREACVGTAPTYHYLLARNKFATSAGCPNTVDDLQPPS